MTQSFSHACPTEAVTPSDASHFFGFYDICPWSSDDTELLLLRFPEPLEGHPDGTNVADVCVWNPQDNTIEKIGETVGWNLHHGARLQWMADGNILFNDCDQGRECARIVSRAGEVLKVLPMGVATLSHDGKVGISPSFGRLGRYYAPYGYKGATSPGIDDPHPADDGIWSIDILTGKTRLLFSLADLAKIAGYPRGSVQYVSHPSFNPSGTQFAFVHTFTTTDETYFRRLYVANSDGGDLRVLWSEKVGHFDWYDDETLIVWGRASGVMRALKRRDFFRHPLMRQLISMGRRWQGPGRNALFSEGLYLLRTDSCTSRRIATKTIPLDGHYSKHPRLNIMLGDTYPDEQNLLSLFVYSFDTDTRVNVATFNHGVTAKGDEYRCDLHPRFNKAGTKIAVDVCEAGTRRLAIVGVASAISLLTN